MIQKRKSDRLKSDDKKKKKCRRTENLKRSLWKKNGKKKLQKDKEERGMKQRSGWVSLCGEKKEKKNGEKSIAIGLDLREARII